MNDPSNDSAAKLATQLFALFAFYLYFGGWIYASDVLGEFGIALGNTDIPAYYLIVYSYSVFFTTACGWLLLASIGGAWYALARYRFIPTAEVILLAVVVAAPFPLIRALAGSRARHDASYFRSGHAKHVTFTPRTDQARKLNPALLATLQSDELRFLLQTKDRYFVFLQPKGEAGALPRATVMDVATADFVASIKTEATLEVK